jgi:EAL domain-containing protein (putative c-di-GMP-specific phosphodiesterase class I)
VTRTLEAWLSESLSVPFTVGGHKVPVTVKIGVALFPDDGNDAAALLRSAETALKNAKLTEAAYAFYTPELGKAMQERRVLESSLRRAPDNGELLLYYQPKVDLEARRLTGAEALMRWMHPERGLVLPATFIPLMEESGLIVEAGMWALKQASTDRARWLGLSLRAPRVAVNVSSAQLRREDFVRSVEAALPAGETQAGIDLEVTESLLMKDAAENIEKLSRIRKLGVSIALDDFGTGYSSLAYLARLPVETIKIDRSFVVAMLEDPSAMTLVSTVISLAHALKLKTVAEGVESEEQAKILRLLRCDQMQGYLISKPMPFDAMTAYLAAVDTSR